LAAWRIVPGSDQSTTKEAQMSKIAQTHAPRRRRWLPGLVVTAGMLFALVPAAQANTRVVDLRSPDARDAARQAHTTPVVDLRSPDARDAARQAHATPMVDLRSPDARDAARPVPPAPSTPEQSSGGFGWGYVGIIGGASILLIVAVAAMRRRRRTGSRRIALES
jgi:hypothetical protein